MNKKLQTKDLINVGIFTALYFSVGTAFAMLGFIPVFVPLLAAIWPLITGIPYMLFLTKVNKFGMVTLTGILSGVLMGLTGMHFWGVPLGLGFGLIADMIMKSGNYKNEKKIVLGYGLFSLWLVGNFIPMYFITEQAYSDFVSGFGEAYAKQTMSFMPSWSFPLIVFSCFIFGIFGALLGKAILKKHFKKAGIQ